MVWDPSGEETLADAGVWTILEELAIDLDYYERDPILRLDDPSYYGDARLEDEITMALRKLHAE